MSQVSMTSLDGSQSVVESNQAVQVHGVNAGGTYLGLVAPGLAAAIVPGPPPSGGGWLWSTGSSKWQFTATLEQVRLLALDEIDRAAGAARLRYITDVPGQAATYLVKAEQAKSFVAVAGLGAVPAYVQGEADATGLTALQAAQYIDGVAAQWAVIGPAIEKARRRGKVNADAATTSVGVATALQAALAALALT